MIYDRRKCQPNILYLARNDFLCIIEGENVSAVDFQHRRMDLVVVVHEVKVMVVLERRAKRHGYFGLSFRRNGCVI